MLVFNSIEFGVKIVDEMMEQKAGKYNDEYRYMDPKSLRGGSEVPRTKTAFSDAVVFVVGGGNYIEYQNLQDYVKNKNGGYSSGPGRSRWKEQLLSK